MQAAALVLGLAQSRCIHQECGIVLLFLTYVEKGQILLCLHGVVDATAKLDPFSADHPATIHAQVLLRVAPSNFDLHSFQQHRKLKHACLLVCRSGCQSTDSRTPA